ncbi:MAG: helix-turn-helix domain-containing protein [Peptococcaceae bacterium]|nr:helix-turn-helix domain-containing protein [Peptococcaceae bacterium]
MEIGNSLKEARLAKGLTLEDVEEETKIRKKYIVALEMERFDVLPGPIYAKAFLKNYAKYLNVNVLEVMDAFKQKQEEQAALEELSQQQEEKEIVTQKISGSRDAGSKGLPHRHYTLLALLAVVVVASLVFFGRGFWSNNVAVHDGGQQAQEQVNTGDNNNDGQQEQTPDEVTPISGIKVDLRVISDRSWVLALVDGDEAFQGELAAGESRSFTGTENIYIRLGNAGVVEVLENDQSLGFLGNWGAVVEKEFKAPPQVQPGNTP